MFFRRVGELASRYRYAVIGAWVLAAIVLNVLVPQLEDVITRDSTPFLPASSDVMQAYKTMGDKFEGSNAGGYAIAVLENSHGLSEADYAYYAKLVQRINQHPDRIAFVQDYI